MTSAEAFVVYVAALFELREAAGRDGEDAVADRMDLPWRAMATAEKDLAKKVAAAVNRLPPA